jgi:hypothetical protein
MSEKFNEIELLFIEETLDKHGEYLIDQLVDDIEDKNLRISDDLMDSLNARVRYEGKDPVLQLSFLGYGRAIEINYHKKEKDSVWQTDTNKEIWGIKQNRIRKKKKNTQWYSKNVYGSLNRLLGILSSEYSDEEIARLKGILEYRQNRKL